MVGEDRKPGRSRRARWIVVGVGLVAAGLGGILALGAVVRRQGPELVAAASRALGHEIRVERLGVSLRGGLGLELEGVEVAPLLTSRRIDLQVRLLPLLHHRIEVERVVLYGAVVQLARNAAGQLDLVGLRPHAAHTEAGAAAAEPAFALAALEVHDGTLHVPGPGDAAPIELTRITIDVRRPHASGPLPITASARVVAPHADVDHVVAVGTLDLAGAAPAFDGSLRAKGTRIRVTGQTLELADATIDGTVTLDAAPRFSGSITAGRGSMRLGRRTLALRHLAIEGRDLAPGTPLPVRVEGEITGHGARLEGLVAEGRLLPSDGPLVFAGQVHAAPVAIGRLAAARLDADVTAGSGFEVRFVARDGRLAGMGAGAGALGQLEPLLGATALGRIRARHPDLLGTAGLAFTRLAGTGRDAAQDVRVTDLEVAGASYTLTGGGRLGQRDVDLRLSLTGSRALTEDVVDGRRYLRVALTDDRGLLVVPLQVRGRLDHPTVTPDPRFVASVKQTVLANAGMDMLARKIGSGAADAVGGVVSGLLDAFGVHRRRH